MKTVQGYIQTNKIGSECQFEFDVEDDATEEEIEEMAKDAAFQHIEWSYTVEDQA